MKQVIVIRKDLKMRRGKEIAQGSHASNKVLADPTWPSNPDIVEWLNTGSKKVCVQVESEQELLDIFDEGLRAGLHSHLIQDYGLTEFNGVLTYTACAVGPNDDDAVDAITGHLKLY